VQPTRRQSRLTHEREGKILRRRRRRRRRGRRRMRRRRSWAELR
jgi:hypothetical protein